MNTYKLPWATVGSKVTGTTAEEVINEAGLNWKVSTEPLYLAGTNTVDGIPVIGNKAKNRFGVVRDSDKEVLGVVRGKYTPIQNRECFGFFDYLVEEGLAKYTHAGELEGGSRIFIIAEMTNDIIVRGDDKIRRYFYLSSSHDGSSSVKAEMSSYRVVCSNGLVARIPGTISVATVHHSSAYKDRIVEAIRILGFSEIYYKALERSIQGLVKTSFSAEDMTKLSEELFPATKDAEGVLKTSTRTKNIRTAVNELFTSGVGNEGSSAWDAYNAVTEYVDHKKNANRVGKDESNFNSSMLGTGAMIKQKAFELLTAQKID